MKKAIVITIVMVLVAGVGGAMWLKTRLNDQTTAKAAQAQAEPEPKKDKYDIGPVDAQEMLELVNKERAKVGVAPLRIDERLTASAQEKADDMQKRDYYGHESPDGVEGYSLVFKHMPDQCRYASENLASLPDASNNSRTVIDTWMHSTKGHREAILDPKYDLIGFGVARDRHNASVVQHFCELNK